MNGNTTGFLYDGAQAIAELRSNALDTVYHTGLAIDEVLAKYGSSGNKTLLTDALMSVIAQANDAQGTENFYAYSPYGQAITLGPDGGNSLQYTGRENDGTGLYYYRARYYDPVIKRFISEDPIGVAGGVNLYAYVRGNPLRFVDPRGLTQRDIDIAWNLMGERVPALERPDSPPSPTLTGDYHGYYGRGGKDLVEIHKDYLGPLDDTQARDLLSTIVHELLHRKYQDLNDDPTKGGDPYQVDTFERPITDSIIDEYLRRRNLPCP